MKTREMSEFSRIRRHFLKSISLGTAALAFNPLGMTTAFSAEAATSGKSVLSFVTGTNRSEMIYEALRPFQREIMDGIREKQIIIKPNLVVTNVPLCATHVDAVRGLLEFLKPLYPEKIIIAESTISSDGTMTGFKNYGYLPLAQDFNVEFVDLNERPTIPLTILDKNLHPLQIPFIDSYLDPNNYFISIARLKTHDRVVATLGLKNMVMGAPLRSYTGRNYKPLMHPSGPRWLNYNMFLIANRIHPQLTILDGVEGHEGNGPISGTPIQHGVALAGMDYIAADRIGAELMGINIGDIGYLNYCASAGMGQIDRSNIEIIGGKDPADYVKKYKLHENIEQQLTWKGEFQ